MRITLEQAKQHLNIESDYRGDDLYIADIITVAECAVCNHLNISGFEEITEPGGQIPPSVIHAMLLLIGNLFSNREPVSFVINYSIPFTYEYLLSPYRKY